MKRVLLLALLGAACVYSGRTSLASFTVTIKDSVGPSNWVLVKPGDTITIFVEVASNDALDAPIINGQFFIKEFTNWGWATVTSYAWNDSFTEDYAPDLDYTFHHDPPFTPGDAADEWGASDVSLDGVGGGGTAFTFLTMNVAISESALNKHSISLNVTDLIFGDSNFNEVIASAGTTYVIIIPAPGAAILGGIGLGLVGWLQRRKRPAPLQNRRDPGT